MEPVRLRRRAARAAIPKRAGGPTRSPQDGVNQEPHLWTWQKTGIHWYCSHCAISMEWLPGRKRGRPLRPLDHVMDPARALHLVHLQGRGADPRLSLSPHRPGDAAGRAGHGRGLAGGVSGRERDADAGARIHVSSVRRTSTGRIAWLCAARRYRLPDGREAGPYRVLDYPDWVNALAVTTDGRAVLVRQFRPGAEEGDAGAARRRSGARRAVARGRHAP